MNEHALKLLSYGLSVIPLGVITKDAQNKKVISYPIPWKKWQTVKPTQQEVSAWKGGNLGVVTGSISGIIVLDCDEYKEGFDRELLRSFNLPITPCQETANGGKQYFFRLPKGVMVKNVVSLGHKGSGIDIRGEGGMVIIAPTITSYGAYTWLIDPATTDFAPIPDKLMGMLLTSAETFKERRLIKDMVGMSEGAGRNDAMASFIGKLLAVTPWSEWDTDVLPASLALNSSFKPPLDQGEFEATYNSICKIEVSRRSEIAKSEAPKKLENRKSLKQLLNTDFPENRFAIEPFFEQGTLNMVSAPPNSWKSWMFFVMAIAIANGTEFVNKYKTEKAKVLIINEEDTERLIADRFRALGIEDKNLEIYFRTAQGSKIDISFCKAILAECKTDGITVVMFDSLRSMHDADENSSTAMQPIMDNLKMLTREGITVIFTHHHKKKSAFDKGDNAEASRGSSAINAAISGHISFEEVERDEGKYIVVRHLKSKVTQKLEPFDIAITINDGKVLFYHGGIHEEESRIAEKTKNGVYDFLVSQGEKWTSIKELNATKIANEKYIRMVLIGLSTSGLVEFGRKSNLVDKYPHLEFKGAINAKFYRARKTSPEEAEEENRDAEAQFALI